jgi:hypothetical protein
VETASNRQEPPNVLCQQRASADMVKRIRKLRWIGTDEEGRSAADSIVQHAVGASCGFRIPGYRLSVASEQRIAALIASNHPMTLHRPDSTRPDCLGDKVPVHISERLPKSAETGHRAKCT